MRTSIKLADIINKNETSIDSEMILFVDNNLIEEYIDKIEWCFKVFNDNSKETDVDFSQTVKDLSLYHIIDFIGDSDSYIDDELAELIEIIVYSVYSTLSVNRIIKSGIVWNN